MKELIKLSHTILSVFALIMISACASVPMSDPAEDIEAKKFEIPTNKSRIYLYRNEALGSAVKIPVTLDGQLKGETAKNVYFVWDVDPGKHEVSCLAESNASLPINATQGKAIYIWQEMKMGMWMAGCALHEVGESVGQRAVMDCSRAQSK